MKSNSVVPGTRTIYNLGRFKMCAELTANAVAVVLFEIQCRPAVKTHTHTHIHKLTF